jgi:hypothetical protein
MARDLETEHIHPQPPQARLVRAADRDLLDAEHPERSRHWNLMIT